MDAGNPGETRSLNAAFFELRFLRLAPGWPTPAFGTNVEWVGTISAGPLLLWGGLSIFSSFSFFVRVRRETGKK
jgi:hypothetical protein